LKQLQTKEMTQIIPFQSSLNTCYIIKDKGAVLIDGAWPGEANSFSKLLSDSGLKPEEIQLIILTHGDFDHVGGAKEIQELTGAKIVMHQKDSDNLEKGIFHWPEGVTVWGKISRAMMMPFVKIKGKFPAAKVDIILDDEGLSLEKYGIPGKVVYTPGHTFGSISVVLESGDAFVGCLAQNRAPFVFRPKLPIYAKDLELLKESWVKVINMGALTIYPGHGNPFPIEKITKFLN
jgi:glyoxylase-like metal-dependent hydrolase (beta-lactamase superfamily II)